MVPKVQIDRLAQGTYRGSVAHGSVDVTEPVIFNSIADALKFFGEDVPQNWARFAEVWYADVSIGMRQLQRLATDSDKIAQELVNLAAAVWSAEEELEALKRSPAVRAYSATESASPTQP